MICSNSFLHTPQIKKIPERLIYQQGDRFIMFSTKTKKTLGRMIVKEEHYGKLKNEDYEFYPKKENYTALYIVGLLANVKKQGVGKAFIQLAKKLAHNERCQDRITVLAMNNQESNILNASSPFFRKLGFSSAEKPGLSDVDRVLKGEKPKNGDWYCCLPMYLPIKKTSQ